MRKTILLISIILCSCGSREESASDNWMVTYLIIRQENEQYIKYLSDNISNRVNRNTENHLVMKFDSLTAEHIKYLTHFESEILKSSSDRLFSSDNHYSAFGKEFISKTNKFKSETEALIASENLRYRNNLILNTNDVAYSNQGISKNNESGKIEVGKTYIPYLDYHFKNLSHEQIAAFLSEKRKNILEIENEFIQTLEKSR